MLEVGMGTLFLVSEKKYSTEYVWNTFCLICRYHGILFLDSANTRNDFSIFYILPQLSRSLPI